MAVKANQLAQTLCRDDHEGGDVKELEAQLYKFTLSQSVPAGPPRGYVSGDVEASCSVADVKRLLDVL